MPEMDWVSLDDQVYLPFTDPPYIARREFRSSGADYDRLTSDDMAELAMLCKRGIYPRADREVFF